MAMRKIRTELAEESVIDQPGLNVMLEPDAEHPIDNSLSLPIGSSDQAAIDQLRMREIWTIAGNLFSEQMETAFKNGLAAYQIANSKPIREWSDQEKQIIDSVLADTLEALKKWTDFLASDELERLITLFPDFESWVGREAPSKNNYALILFSKFTEVLKDSITYIENEARAVKSWKTEKYTFAEFANTTDPEDGHRIESHLERAIKKAREGSALINTAAGRAKNITHANHGISNSIKGFTVGDVLDGLSRQAIVADTHRPTELREDVLLTCPLPPLFGITDSTSPADMKRIKAQPVITEYMLAILDVFGTIGMKSLEANEPFPAVTREQIHGYLSGDIYRDGSLSPEKLKQMDHDIQVLGAVRINTDITRHLERMGIFPDSPTSYGENLLTVSISDKMRRGKPRREYRLLRLPPTFAIARTFDQFTSYPISALNSPDSNVRETVSRESIKLYLARRIALMRYDEQEAKKQYREKSRFLPSGEEPDTPLESMYRKKRVIIIDSLLKETGNSTTDRTLRKRNIDYAEQLLKRWQTITLPGGYSFISGYQIETQRGKKVKIHIKI